ncbi:MAG TPA: DNA cytosine methyltransferase [Rhodocyclaceae bacterium]|nr:DNA cytosine methyltransferase [Rhodocyclaceae bacterium]
MTAPRAYYNERDKHAAECIRNAIAAGLVAPGDVDDRSIEDVCPDDLRGYTQCHFFAGIGLWSYSLRRAGWPDDRPVWTGSCPCQPFSAAGKGAGFADERHLWPAWHWLVQQHRPGVIFGEQVEGKDGRMWLDLVSTDLEAGGYTCGPVVFPSAGVGAPNIRHRLYWVADPNGGQRGWLAGSGRGERDGTPAGRQQGDGEPQRGLVAGRLADSDGQRQPEGRPHHAAPWDDVLGGRGANSRLGDASGTRLAHPETPDAAGAWPGSQRRATAEPGRPHDPWGSLEWIACTDGKFRPTQSSVQRVVAGNSSGLEFLLSTPETAEIWPLAIRQKGDVQKLRAYGNAINPVVAAEVIAAYMEMNR